MWGSEIFTCLMLCLTFSKRPFSLGWRKWSEGAIHFPGGDKHRELTARGCCSVSHLWWPCAVHANAPSMLLHGQWWPCAGALSSQVTVWQLGLIFCHLFSLAMLQCLVQQSFPCAGGGGARACPWGSLGPGSGSFTQLQDCTGEASSSPGLRRQLPVTCL